MIQRLETPSSVAPQDSYERTNVKFKMCEVLNSREKLDAVQK